MGTPWASTSTTREGRLIRRGVDRLRARSAASSYGSVSVRGRMRHAFVAVPNKTGPLRVVGFRGKRGIVPRQP